MKPETIQKCKEICANQKDTIEYWIRFGSIWEQAQGILIKNVATSN